MSADRPCCAARPRITPTSPWWSILPTTPELLATLAASGGATGFAFRARLAAKAFAHTAAYDALVADYLPRQHEDEPSLPAATGHCAHAHRDAALWREPAPARRVLPRRRRSAGQHRRRALRAGQGTVLQQHRRCRHRAGMRAPVRQPGLRDRQACQSLWRRPSQRTCAMPTNWPIAPIPTSAFGGIIAFNRPLDADYGSADPRTAVRRSAGGTGAVAGHRRGAGRQAQCARPAHRNAAARTACGARTAQRRRRRAGPGSRCRRASTSTR